MNLMSLKRKLGSRSGVTLVELLVVILIVTILSVSLLPLLKRYITDAKYASEPIPTIGNLRTMVGLYQYDHDRLPGMKLTDTGDKVDEEIAKVSTHPGGISTLAANATALQTFVAVTNDGVTAYFPSYYTTINSTTCTIGGTNETGIVDHFANQVVVDYKDLKGKYARPNHFQYRVMNGGYNTDAYAYVIGVFGDSDGLPSGTGYAVIEIVNPSAEAKFVGTWKRNTAVETDAGQIVMQDNTESGIGSGNGTSTKKKNLCWIGVPNLYLSTTKSEVATGIKDLRDAGWEF